MPFTTSRVQPETGAMLRYEHPFYPRKMLTSPYEAGVA